MNPSQYSKDPQGEQIYQDSTRPCLTAMNCWRWYLKMSPYQVTRLIVVGLLIIIVTPTFLSHVSYFTQRQSHFNPSLARIPSDFENTSANQDGYSSRQSMSAEQSSPEVDLRDVPTTDVRVIAVYKPPEGETPKKRYPQAVIIGYAKCGTRATLDYLNMHPNIVSSRAERHFYDDDEIFERGYEWYLDSMPLTYSDQITIEKTPAYVETERAVKEMSRMFPKVKIICLVRDPVVRLLSQDAQLAAKFPDHKTTDLFLDENGDFDPGKPWLRVGIYHETLSRWLKAFPREQILVLSGEEIIAQPLKSVRQIVDFLGVKPIYNNANFVFNSTKGFYCTRGFKPDAKLACLGDSKGRPHRSITPEQEEMLYNFYRPHNEKLFQLLNQTFNWDRPKPQTVER